jgi:hypothetical protein
MQTALKIGLGTAIGLYFTLGASSFAADMTEVDGYWQRQSDYMPMNGLAHIMNAQNNPMYADPDAVQRHPIRWICWPYEGCGWAGDQHFWGPRPMRPYRLNGYVRPYHDYDRYGERPY